MSLSALSLISNSAQLTFRPGWSNRDAATSWKIPARRCERAQNGSPGIARARHIVGTHFIFAIEIWQKNISMANTLAELEQRPSPGPLRGPASLQTVKEKPPISRCHPPGSSPAIVTRTLSHEEEGADSQWLPCLGDRRPTQPSLLGGSLTI